MWHVQVFWLVWEDTCNNVWGGEIDPAVGRWFHPTRRRGSLWRHPERNVPGLEPVHVPDNWWLRQTSRPRTPTMHDGSPRPLHPPNGCTSPSQYCPSTPGGLPASLRTANQWPNCATDSMRTTFPADDQHAVPFSPGNTLKLDLTLPRIMNIGSCVIGVPFSSQTSPDSMSLLVTGVWGYGGGPNTTDTLGGPWWYGAAFVWTDERTW